jgi:hypothetical protein
LEKTKLPLLSLERNSPRMDTHNRKKFSFLTQRLLELTLLSLLKKIQRLELTKKLTLKLEKILITQDTHNQRRYLFSIQKLLEPILLSWLKILFKKMRRKKHLLVSTNK